ncbi:BglG family transcription antiterminator LicT [Pectinatus cerevisiiphilus]|uniref:BglG family transcriptional antiterminator n=1 Tax=Pectinatus cerevisiiphilus TaxID=86956 RepID=A0A4V2URM8_9FIRM|nr:PRD domain-containing protein [Pectinatus cerevisiiphilus]TCS78192.1 BglG family transcriptional antiterminator [Pectinatus cerevisiiphilus]
MLIKKILNNNVVLSNNAAGQEVVVMGCGIAFKKRPGENIENSRIDKIYTLSNHEILEKFKVLLADLSIEYMEISNKIITLAEKTLGKKLNEKIYISLTDHIHMAVQRVQNGHVIHNMMIWEIARFYTNEFNIGKDAIQEINKKFMINMPEDEAGFIALHIIDAQMEENHPMAVHILQLIEEITNIVRYSCHIEFDTESIQYYRFITHLKFFAKKIFQKQNSINGIDQELVMLIEKKYPKATVCAKKIAEFIEQKYYYPINSDEYFYLIIHIAKIVYKK